MNRLLLMFFLIIGLGNNSVAQQISLNQCVEMAKVNYPQYKQLELIEKSREYSVASAEKGMLPRVVLGAQASYQSDVTRFPLSLPGVNIPELSKDQYRVYGDVSQSVTDMLTIVRHKKELADANSQTELRKAEAELDKVEERIQQLYFGIMIIDVKIEQTELIKSDISAGIDRVNSAVANGVALSSSADLLKAELLTVNQSQLELRAARRSYLQMLSLFTGITFDDSVQLAEPQEVMPVSTVNRQELKVFESMSHVADIQRKTIDYVVKPNLNLFVQGGYGKPGLNMLEDKFDLFYIGGVRLSWNISGFYTHKRERQLNALNKSLIDVQRETFLFEVNQAMVQQREDIAGFDALIAGDHEIIELRNNVKLAAQSRLEYGTTTPSDYLSYVNAESQARQNLNIHRIQRLMALYRLKTISGN